jgi:hypothetical protein
MGIFSRRYASPEESPQKATPTESDLQKAKQWKEYCDSELIPTEQSDCSLSKVQSILAPMQKLWQRAIAALMKEPELKIRRKLDRYGHIYWHVYDPYTGKSVSFVSELELLSWIDNLNSRSRR